MDPRLFGHSHWYAQPEPTRPSRPVHATGQPIQCPARRVVQIPVHFVGSEPVDRSVSALKIQKVFRGYLVRKSLNKIRDIKAKVDEIGERLQSDEYVELIRSDKKERLRMNETLMSLLLKLDSICGLDFGVRLCRKAVIREAIALQDRIDAVVAADSVPNGDSVDQETEISVCSETVVSTHDDLDIPESSGNLTVKNARDPGDPIECWEMVMDESCVSEGRDASEAEVIDVGVDVEFKVDDNEAKDGKLEEYSSPVATDEECGNGTVSNENDRNREFLVRMMADNEKMMRMMEQLCERSESQTRMLNALTHRVELLENAFLCERLTRNKEKKKKKAAAAADHHLTR